MIGSTAKIISLIVTVAIVLIFGALSYEVLRGFLLPMFLAVLLVLMFKPLHLWFTQLCRGRERVGALLTTVAVALIVLLPTGLLLYLAGRETVHLIQNLDQAELADKVLKIVERINARLPEAAQIPLPKEDLTKTLGQIVSGARVELQQAAGPLFLGATALVATLVQYLVLTAVMLLSFYYFLIDGPLLRATFTSLVPIEERHKTALIGKFSSIARAVIVAMLVSAVVQGLLGGVGYFLVSMNNVFLLTVLTMIFSLVPFVGATVVWVPCVLWLYIYDDRPWAAAILGVYGVLVISMADNLIKPMMLHGQSNIHPLLALLSILGGASALGPIGILVGPMVLALLQTGVVILRNEIAAMDVEQNGEASTAASSSAAVRVKPAAKRSE